jgi:hypothetical protein
VKLTSAFLNFSLKSGSGRRARMGNNPKNVYVGNGKEWQKRALVQKRRKVHTSQARLFNKSAPRKGNKEHAFNIMVDAR